MENSEISKKTLAPSPGPYKIWGSDLIEANTIEQMETAMRIPPAIRGALLPDAHLGYALPIGGVILLENAISPSYIGYDISCMMMLSIFDLRVEDFEKHREDFAHSLRKSTYFGIGRGPNKYDHPVMDDKRWRVSKTIGKVKAKALNQLGTSGGGNHFADLMKVELEDREAIGLLTHSGSRGAGHNLATAYVNLAAKETQRSATGIPKAHGWLRLDSDAGREYLAAMQLMGDYAYANHELIHAEFARNAALEVREMMWNRHNFAWVTEDGIIHRKGATPAREGQIGLIPGSSGATSYIVEGKGHPESLFSSSHGAGRPFSRTQAKKQHQPDAFRAHMRRKDVLHFGITPDETFAAYKDINEVMARQEDLVQVIGRMEPRVVVMGGKADDGD